MAAETTHQSSQGQGWKERGWQGAILRGLGAKDYTATVLGRESIAPHVLRLWLASPELFEDVEPSPTAWLRFWFPDPAGAATLHQRGYTIARSDPPDEQGHHSGQRRFAVDFVLHQPAGPATIWAMAAQAGQQITFMAYGSTRFEVPTEWPAGYLLIGDAASSAAIRGILEVLPAQVPAELYLEEHDPADRLIPLPSHPRLRIHWVPRTGPEALAAALETRDWSDWYAWVGVEAGSLKHLRKRLKEEFGFPKTEQHLQAYWTEGQSMGRQKASPAAESQVADNPAPIIAESVAAPPAAAITPPPPTTPAPAAESQWRSQAGSRLLAPLRQTFQLAGAIQAAITLIELAPYVLLTELARRLLAGASAAALWPLGFWALGLLGLGTLLSAALLWWLHGVDARFERDLRARLLDKISRLPLGWFDRHTSGQVKQLIQDDTLALHYLVTHAVPEAAAAVTAPIAVLVYLFVVDWRLALLLFVPVLVYLVLMIMMMGKSASQIPKAARWAEKMNSEASGYLEGQPVIRVFGGAASAAFRLRLGEYLQFLSDWQRPFIGFKSVMEMVTRPATSLLLIALLGSWLVGRGTLEPVKLLPFLLLGTTFGGRLLGISYGMMGLNTGRLAARRLQQVLDEPELTVPDRARSAPSDRQPERGLPVHFDQVSFSYREGVPVLQDISLTLQPGTLTALVGSSGAGKSTLAALLARFYDVTVGAIRIGDHDICDLSFEELYTRVGFVFQDAQLVQGSVSENIALACPEATPEQIVAAAQAAQIHERILRMPQGYDTVLGPDAALSGGERQRLTIARALLADTPILVLDEATAFADPESEYLVQQALSRLTAGRTVLVIAHRLHTITQADCIVVLEQGRIVESGTHAQLLARAGRYRQLWDAAPPPADVAAQSDTTAQPDAAAQAPFREARL